MPTDGLARPLRRNFERGAHTPEPGKSRVSIPGAKPSRWWIEREECEELRLHSASVEQGMRASSAAPPQDSQDRKRIRLFPPEATPSLDSLLQAIEFESNSYNSRHNDLPNESS